MSLGPLHVIKQSNKINSASVIFLHGSGDTGQGLLDWLSNVWFDRYNITPDVPEHKETLDSVGTEIKSLINKVVQSGIPLNRIVIGGFSMGGALALHTAYRFNPGLAGVFTLSSFLNNDSAIYSELKAAETPLYMCHGDRDTMVPIAWGQKTYQDLTKLGINAQFIPIKNTMHELKKQEIQGLFEWIQKILPPLESHK